MCGDVSTAFMKRYAQRHLHKRKPNRVCVCVSRGAQGMCSACLTHKGGSVPSVSPTQAAPALQFGRRAAREIAVLVSGAFTEGMGFINRVIARVFLV